MSKTNEKRCRTNALPQIVQTVQKEPYGKKYKLSNKLISQFKRSQFCFGLKTLIIVKINVIINEEASLLKGFELCSVNTLSFQY